MEEKLQGGYHTGTITPPQTGLRFFPYFVVEPVNWVEEKLLGGYWYNHTTPDWVTVLSLFCGRACELGEGEAKRVPVKLHHARLGYGSILQYSVVEPVNWVEKKLLGRYGTITLGYSSIPILW